MKILYFCVSSVLPLWLIVSYEAMKQCLFQGLFRHRIFELLVGEVILMLPDVFSHLCS